MADTITTDLSPATIADDTVSLRSWIAVLCGVLGGFMAVLNIMITNASLKDIQGALSATLEEGSWVSTSFLAAEIVVIPLSGWLCRVFSLRRYIIGTTIAFLFLSVMTAFAWDVNSMIAIRALSGLAGGALIPVSFSIILTLLPASKQAVGLGIWSLTATQAPSLGPTLGGWLTESLGWEYIFYLQLIPGAVMLAGLWFGLPRERMNLSLLKKGDWLGIFLMALGLAATTIVLEEGNRKDWFESDLIARGAVVSAVALTLFVIVELRQQHPFIDLRLLGRRNFGVANLINVTFGMGLFGSIYLVPLYFAQIQGYNSFQIGTVIMWTGIPQIFLVPVVLRLMQFVDPRKLVAVGIMIFGSSYFMNVFITHDSAYDQFMWANIVRAMGQPFILVCLSVVATTGLDKEHAGSASGLFNGMRNFGGALGIALLSTFVTRRQHFHSNHVLENLSAYDPETLGKIEQLQQHFMNFNSDADLARTQALAAIKHVARQETLVMAYSDAFFVLGCAFTATLVLTFFLAPTVTPTRNSKP
jgi:MFS transporter, DHA2 family, multidrug resistance protein